MEQKQQDHHSSSHRMQHVPILYLTLKTEGGGGAQFTLFLVNL